jgi:hypothetical protein
VSELPVAATRDAWARLGRRVHRLLTLPAGAIVVACLFLPLLGDCDHTTVRAADTPALWPLFGVFALIALGALVPRRGWARAFALAVELGWYAAALVWIAATGRDGRWLGTIAIGLMAAVRYAVDDPEARLASESILIATVSGFLFTCAAFFTEPLVGVELAIVASGAVLVGAIVWGIERSGPLGARGRAIVIAAAITALAGYAFVLVHAPWQPAPSPGDHPFARDLGPALHDAAHGG